MKDEQILASAPEGAESISLVGHYIKSPFNNVFFYSGSEWLRTDPTILCCSRSLADIQTIVELRKQIAELEKELTKSTDQNDLILDEFIRVKLLTDNTEIHQLCERAHIRMRQNVSVIDRNKSLVAKVKELEKQLSPDLFWDANNTETSFESLYELMEDRFEDGAELGGTVEVQRAALLQNETYVFTKIDNDDYSFEYELQESSK